MHKRFHFDFIGLIEPFQEGQSIEEYKRRLRMKHAATNVSGKIWVFIESNMEVTIISDEEQQLTLRLQNQQIIGGDFNVIRHAEEKLGGLPVTFEETEDFNHCISSCNLEEVQFKGSKFTWWNERIEDECIFKRLDRFLVNNKIQDLFPVLEVENLPRSGSDHAPVLLYCNTVQEQIIKPFKFLNFWLKKNSCMEVIKQIWKEKAFGNPFMIFHQKLKRTKVALTKWSKQSFGNIFQEIATLEEVIKIKENQFEENPPGENRASLFKIQVELIVQLKKEEEYWKQKTEFQWFKEGENNTKFFHAIVLGRRSRLKISRIQNENTE
ncbi:uncharacterized protein LOC124896806 [Capsicum annuum]|uniref:uncharacterized protein LOC124896806 n=1 Tax=Capsicum annuum TaxID=4072 RepID=UPI001FB18D00|nr:uncharacterized protein LOC124896806 [Capsicum annuum]